MDSLSPSPGTPLIITHIYLAAQRTLPRNSPCSRRACTALSRLYPSDATQLPALVVTTAKSFNMAEVSADKGYSGQECHNAISHTEAKPFSMFKENARDGIGRLFRKMFQFFQSRRDEFLAHYHRRSNVESTVIVMKAKHRRCRSQQIGSSGKERSALQDSLPQYLLPDLGNV
jgi:hypothetical protein